MTSEVLLLNLEAVVMAADSAVTLSGSERRFSQAGIEKIYLINEQGPVAAMLYGGGSYCGLPWRTVLGQFREFCGGDLLTIDDYASKLVKYLSEIEKHTDVGIDQNYEINNFNIYIDDFVHDYALWLLAVGWTPGGPIDEEKAKLALRYYEEEVLIDDHAIMDEDDVNAGPPLRARIEPSQRLTDLVTKNIGPAMSAAMGRKFDGAAFPESCVEPLIRLSVASLLVEWLPQSSMITGLVMSGFGRNQALPAVYSFKFVGAFGGILKTRRAISGRPKPHVEPVIFHSYAQDQLIRAFVYGAIPEYEYHVRQATTEYLNRILHDVIEVVAETDKKLAQKVADIVDPVPRLAPYLGLSMAREERANEVFQTLWPALDSANADVLAAHALKLMELTVLEHELLAEPSVARPIWTLAMERGRHVWAKDGVKQ